MVNLETLIGIKVFVKNYDEPIGTLKDIVMDIGEGRVHNIVVDYRRYFHSIKLVEYSLIDKITHNSIVIESVDALKDIKKKSNFLELFTYTKGVELEVYDGNNALIGFFKDVYIKKDTGVLIAYIISNGFIDDITNGLMVLRDVDKFTFENNKLKIKVPLENCSIDILGGLKNLLEL